MTIFLHWPNRTSSKRSQNRKEVIRKMAKNNYYCIYARCATEKQAKEGSSLSSQVKLLKDYAEERGLEVKAVIKATGTSKKALKNLKEEIKGGDYAGVICVSKDRIARTTRELMGFMDFIDELGMELIFAGHGRGEKAENQFVTTVNELFEETRKRLLRDYAEREEEWKEKHESA